MMITYVIIYLTVTVLVLFGNFLTDNKGMEVLLTFVSTFYLW